MGHDDAFVRRITVRLLMRYMFLVSTAFMNALRATSNGVSVLDD